MKNIINNTLKNLESDEWMAIMQASGILEKAFKKRMYSVQLNPNKQDETDIWGIAFAFDLTQEGWR